jgi:hypothetical protein
MGVKSNDLSYTQGNFHFILIHKIKHYHDPDHLHFGSDPGDPENMNYGHGMNYGIMENVRRVC